MLVGSVTNDDLGSEVDNLIEYFSPTTESDFLRRYNEIIFLTRPNTDNIFVGE